jgi:uncharacterized protein (DUF362 family)
MRLIAKNRRRIILLCAGFVAWMCWDLIQAHNAGVGMYRSFFAASEAALKTPAATTVAIVRSNDPALANPCPTTAEEIGYSTIAQMVRRAVDLAGGLQGVAKSGDTVLIKPNIVQADSSGSGGVTDIRVVRALVYLVDEIDHGNMRIFVGDGSPRPFTTFEKATGTSQKAWQQLFDVPGYQQLKSEALADGVDFHLVNLNGNSDTNPWSELDTLAVPGGGSAQPQGGKYFLHQNVIKANVYITVPVLKMHKEAGFTCALKNQIGIAPSTRYGFNKTTGVLQENRTHKLQHLAQAPYNWQDKEIVDLSALARIRLAVVDAIACLESDKTPVYTPDRANIHITNRVKLNTIVAGYDPVAVDHVCCRIIGLNPDDIEHITLAERVGLGTNNPDSIRVVGSSVDGTRRVFKKPQTWSGLYGQGNRTWLLNGPFPATGRPDPMKFEFLPGEADIAPVAGAAGWSQPVYFINDQIMLNEYYQSRGTSTNNVVSYAFAYVTAPSDQRAELWVGSDEALSLFVNGAIVYAYAGTRSFEGTECYKDTVTVTLRKGLNRLLVKAYQNIGNFNFSVNICDVEPNVLYRGNRVWGLKFETDAHAVTAVDGPHDPGVPGMARLQCFPNPFNPSTTLRYALSARSHTTLSVYNALGERVAEPVNAEREAGDHDVLFNASALPSGIYFCRLQARPIEGGQTGSYVDTKKVLLVK